MLTVPESFLGLKVGDRIARAEDELRQLDPKRQGKAEGRRAEEAVPPCGAFGGPPDVMQAHKDSRRDEPDQIADE